MKKVANRRDHYQSRSKKVSNSSSIHFKRNGENGSRAHYKVDCNGYFVWDSEIGPKKI